MAKVYRILEYDGDLQSLILQLDHRLIDSKGKSFSSDVQIREIGIFGSDEVQSYLNPV